VRFSQFKISQQFCSSILFRTVTFSNFYVRINHHHHHHVFTFYFNVFIPKGSIPFGVINVIFLKSKKPFRARFHKTLRFYFMFYLERYNKFLSFYFTNSSQIDENFCRFDQ